MSNQEFGETPGHTLPVLSGSAAPPAESAAQAPAADIGLAADSPISQQLWQDENDPDDLSSRHKSFHTDVNFDVPAGAPASPQPAVNPAVMYAPAVGAGANLLSSAAAPGGTGGQPSGQHPSMPAPGMAFSFSPKSPTGEAAADAAPAPVSTAASSAAASGAELPAATPATAPSQAPDPSTFDFFAASKKSPPSQAQSTTKPAKSAAVGEPESKAQLQTPVSDQPANEPEIDIPEGVPAVVAKALKAAAQAPKAQPADENPGLKDEESLFPDESVNRKKKDESAKKDDDDDETQAVRRFRRTINQGDQPPAPEPAKSHFEIAGMKFSRMKVISGILALFIGVPIMLLLVNLVGATFSSMTQGGAGGIPSLNGRWDFGVLDTKGRTVKNDLMISQSGSNFTGQGFEPGYRYIVQGVYQYPKVQFVKQYIDQSSQPIKEAKPVTFVGQVDWVNPNPGQGAIPWRVHMSGVWQLQRRVGYGWRGQILTLSNKWEAGLVQQTAPPAGGSSSPAFSMTAGMPQPATGQTNWITDLLGVPGPNNHNWAGFFARIAGFLLLIGLVLVFCSLKLFGPAGLINIWAKKEYIPSQYRSQHYRVVKEFGKPLRAGGLPLGTRADWNITKFWWPRLLSIPPELRVANPHILVLGAGSKGKSRLLASMAAHDIEANDRAVVVIDSDGGLVDMLIHWMASHHKGKEISKRVVIVDPTHGGNGLGYNPLEYPDDGDLQNAASSLVFGFKAIYTEPPGAQSQWNQQTADILRNSAILLMANGKTLVDLPVLLSENDFRDVLLEKIERQKNDKAEYTALVEAWARYKRMARTDQWINWIEPILNRVNPMLGDPRIRPILTRPKGDLNLKEIINEKKVLLVKVPQGHMDQNANLLGSLLVTGLKQAALSLSLKSSSKRNQCALYLDEFDSFIEKETFDTITSETKKFRIGIIGAVKTLQGMPEDYRNQIIINVGTMCIFALGKKDGDILGPQMFRVDGRKIKNQTLQNIFNKVNTTPQFELITDEEKLNIDRVVGQEERTFFCYRVGTIAGVFQMRSPEFKDVAEKDVNFGLIDKMYARSIKEDA